MRIGIVGGGVGGLFSAFYLRQKGYQVDLFERGVCGRACSWDAAGMLAPINELEFQELPLLRAGMASRNLYPGIEAVLGDIGLLRKGTLEVVLVPDDEGYLKRLFDFQVQQGLPVEWVPGHKLQAFEPYLSRNLPAGIWSPADWQVDNRKLVQALVDYLQKSGVNIRENCPVRTWSVQGEKVEVFLEDERQFVDKLVVAPGLGRDLPLPYKVYPVRGEMVSLRPPSVGFLEKVVRIKTQVLGNAYVVPKEGRILMGSTAEEKGFSPVNTAGGLLDILRKCYAAVPGVYELDVVETWAGLRPSTLSRLPICDQEGDLPIYHLNGLYRHGILLGPLLGSAMAELVESGRRMPEVEAFRLLKSSL